MASLNTLLASLGITESELVEVPLPPPGTRCWNNPIIRKAILDSIPPNGSRTLASLIRVDQSSFHDTTPYLYQHISVAEPQDEDRVEEFSYHGLFVARPIPRGIYTQSLHHYLALKGASQARIKHYLKDVQAITMSDPACETAGIDISALSFAYPSLLSVTTQDYVHSWRGGLVNARVYRRDVHEGMQYLSLHISDVPGLKPDSCKSRLGSNPAGGLWKVEELFVDAEGAPDFAGVGRTLDQGLDLSSLRAFKVVNFWLSLGDLESILTKAPLLVSLDIATRWTLSPMDLERLVELCPLLEDLALRPGFSQTVWSLSLEESFLVLSSLRNLKKVVIPLDVHRTLLPTSTRPAANGTPLIRKDWPTPGSLPHLREIHLVLFQEDLLESSPGDLAFALMADIPLRVNVSLNLAALGSWNHGVGELKEMLEALVEEVVRLRDVAVRLPALGEKEQTEGRPGWVQV